MPLNHNEIVALHFAAHAAEYDRNATLQASVAATLAGYLPPMQRPAVLEVGCGTGLLTRHLVERYPNGSFLITDLVPEMLDVCKARCASANDLDLRFDLLNGDTPAPGETFDLIALSMTAQWFADPVAAIGSLARLLNPGGCLAYATLGPGCFPEWRRALDDCGLPAGLIDMPPLPGTMHEETRVVDYGSAIVFLDTLKAIGAATPRPGYRPISPGALRRAVRQLERDSSGRVTWRIAYGNIPAHNPLGA